MIRAACIGLGWWSDELAAAVQGKSDAIKANAINGVAGHNLAQDAQLIVAHVGQEGE